MKSHFGVNVIIILAIVLAGCGPVTPFVPTTPTKEIAPTSAYEEVFVDCRWSGIGFVWIDQNGDGEYQDGEQPVPDIPVFVDDTYHGYTDVGDKIKTSMSGEANLSVWLPGCPYVKFEIYIQVPDGYTLTTQPRVKVEGSEKRFYFGLTYLPGVSTATPLPPAPVCKAHSFPTDSISGFSIDDSGAIWIGTWSSGVYRQVAGQTDWTHWDIKQYPALNHVFGLKSKSGRTWVITQRGISVLNGDTWQPYPEDDSVFREIVNDAAIEEDGSVWFATDTGVFYFSFATHSWQSIPTSPDLIDVSFSAVDIATDGSIWFIVDTWTVAQLIWPDRKGFPEWRIYSKLAYGENIIHVPFLEIQDFAADTSGNVWFVGLGGLTRYNVSSDTWFPQYYQVDIYYLEKEFWYVAPAADGSAWITDQSTLYHFFPAGTKTDKDIMLEYTTGGNIPDVHPLISIKVGPDGKVWFIMRHEAYECEFFD